MYKSVLNQNKEYFNDVEFDIILDFETSHKMKPFAWVNI